MYEPFHDYKPTSNVKNKWIEATCAQYCASLDYDFFACNLVDNIANTVAISDRSSVGETLLFPY